MTFLSFPKHHTNEASYCIPGQFQRDRGRRKVVVQPTNEKWLRTFQHIVTTAGKSLELNKSHINISHTYSSQWKYLDLGRLTILELTSECLIKRMTNLISGSSDRRYLGILGVLNACNKLQNCCLKSYSIFHCQISGSRTLLTTN
jgi:hypothetical protein